MMTQDEVLKELRSVIATNQQFTTWTISTPHIVELVNRAIKQEREACAVLCEQLSDTSLDLRFGAAIRARGE